MEKSILEQYVELNYSTRKIAQLLNLSQTNVRHWLKKYNLKTNMQPFNEKEYSCNCGETNPENRKFYYLILEVDILQIIREFNSYDDDQQIKKIDNYFACRAKAQ